MLIIFSSVIILSNCTLVFALTEDEVQAMVDSSGKVAVTGNLFIWFICAFAFLKVSQKVDSYMASLGLNVGHTGGSLLSDLVATGRGLAMANGVLSGKGFTDGSLNGGLGKSSSQTDTNFLHGGLAGAVGRKYDSTVKTLASDKGSNSLASSIFNNSMKNNGSLATNGISKIAKGDIKKDGMITGQKASQAFSSYFSNSLNANSNSLQSSNTNVNSITADNNLLSNSPLDTNISSLLNSTTQISNQNDIDTNGMQTLNNNINGGQGLKNIQTINPTQSVANNPISNISNNQLTDENNNISPINKVITDDNIGRLESTTQMQPTAENVTPTVDTVISSHQPVSPMQTNIGNNETIGSIDTTNTQTIHNQFTSNTADTFDNISPQTTDNMSIPTYSNVEIGGGHIMGTETSESHPQGVNFAMYNTEQYSKPNGDYTTVTSNDNSKWYKQYETKAEVKTPYQKQDGTIGYNSKLVDKLPEPPKRKDRL